MMSSSAMLKQTYAKVIPPKTPTMQSVFFKNIKSNLNNNKKTNSIMTKAHSKTREELTSMKVKELKDMVKKHNLHNQIKRYTTMRKAALIDALMSHSSAKDSKSSPAKPPPPAEPEQSLKRMKPRKKKAPPKKGQPKAKVPKNPPLYSKEEGGLLRGAIADYERRYGKIDTSQLDKKPSNIVEGKRKRGRPRRYAP